MQILTACRALVFGFFCLLLSATPAGDGHVAEWSYTDRTYGNDAYQRDPSSDPESAAQSSSTTSNIALQNILSVTTGMFVAITKSGRMQANTRRGKHFNNY